MTWHQWHQVAVSARRMGFSSRRLAANASSLHSLQGMEAASGLRFNRSTSRWSEDGA